MNSVYSSEVIQQILDRWGVGRLLSIRFLGYVGRQIWFHAIETTRGEFELYSYEDSAREYAQPLLRSYFQTRSGAVYPQLVHSFERKHVLCQTVVKLPISHKQAMTELRQLEGLQLVNIFRVIGGILQLELEKGFGIYTYGRWCLQTRYKGKSNVIADPQLHSLDRVDTELAAVTARNVRVKKAQIVRGWFEIFFTDRLSLHCVSSEQHPAALILFPNRKPKLSICSETELYYVKSL